MKGKDLILEAVKDAGAGHVFLFVGGLVDPLLPALAADQQLVSVLTANEAGQRMRRTAMPTPAGDSERPS